MAGIFVTGTDTEIGKTQVACALLNAMSKQNIKAVGMKPVASGAEHIGGSGTESGTESGAESGADASSDQWQNEDALKLMKASSVQLPYELINTYLFKTPASPHIAATLDHKKINLDKIVDCYKLIEQQAEFVVVEGVGGWLAPLNDQQTVEDMALALQLPVVLVVGMRLGCLNHALLTAQRIQQSGLMLAGWVANIMDDNFSFLDENIHTLVEGIDAPLIAQLNYNEKEFNTNYEKSIILLVNAK